MSLCATRRVLRLSRGSSLPRVGACWPTRLWALSTGPGRLRLAWMRSATAMSPTSSRSTIPHPDASHCQLNCGGRDVEFVGRPSDSERRAKDCRAAVEPDTFSRFDRARGRAAWSRRLFKDIDNPSWGMIKAFADAFAPAEPVLDGSGSSAFGTPAETTFGSGSFQGRACVILRWRCDPDASSSRITAPNAHGRWTLSDPTNRVSRRRRRIVALCVRDVRDPGRSF